MLSHGSAMARAAEARSGRAARRLAVVNWPVLQPIDQRAGAERTPAGTSGQVGEPAMDAAREAHMGRSQIATQDAGIGAGGASFQAADGLLLGDDAPGDRLVIEGGF